MRGVDGHWLLLSGCLITLPAAASELIHVYVDALTPPMVVSSQGNQAEAGALIEVVDALGQELAVKVRHMAVSRKRLEPALLGGKAHIGCYFNPQWAQARDALLWSDPVMPQVERVVTLTRQGLQINQIEDFRGRRVALMLGYVYPSLQSLEANGAVTRLDETKVDAQFRLVIRGLADLLVQAEPVIADYLHRNPGHEKLFTVQPMRFSSTPTYCAVSPQSPYSLDKINAALKRLVVAGRIDAILDRYQLSRMPR